MTCSAVCGAFLSGLFFRIGLAGADRFDLGPDGNHRVAETIELVLRFALRRLDHDRAGNRPGNGRRVKAVIHQTLGDVFHFDARALARPQVENALVRHEAVLAL